MRRLLSFALAVAALAAAPDAWAGAILDPAAYLSTYNEATYSGYQSNNGVVYNDQPYQTQGSQSSISTTSSQSYTPYFGNPILSGTTSGTATTTPGTGDFSSLQLSASADVTNTADGGTQQAGTIYSGNFTVTGPTQFSMTVTGNSSGYFAATAGSISSSALASLSNTSGLSDYYVSYDFLYFVDPFIRYGSSNPGTLTYSGILTPGTYSIYASASASTDKPFAYGTLASDASIDVSLTLTPATPEPASLTLLGLGACGLAGYGWRRRRAVTA